MIDSFVFIIFLMLSVLSIYYDYRENRIPNKMIIPFLALAVLLKTIHLVNDSRQYLGLFLFCIMEAIVISFCFYKLKIWAGGDTKLFILMSILVPSVVYKNGRQESIIAIVIIIYSLSFIYIILESIYLNFKQEEVVSKKNNNKQNYLGLFLGWLFIFSVIGLIQNCFILFLYDIYYRFYILIMLFKVIIVLVIGKYYSRVSPIIKSFIILLYFVSICMCFNNNILLSFDIRNITLVTIIFLIRLWAGRYNYQKINVKDLKKGMILSAGTVVGFINSNIEGLPENISEDMSARLSDEEIDSILKWSDSKYGIKEIIIVRRIPFAIFISIGFAVYIIGMIVWSNI